MKLLGRKIGKSGGKVLDADDILRELFIVDNWKKFDKVEKRKVCRYYSS